MIVQIFFLRKNAYLDKRRRPQSEEFVQCGKGGGGSSDVDSTLFGGKNIGFYEIYGVSARTWGRGLSQCGQFVDKEGGGQFFAILCGRLLWTAP